MDPNSIKKLFRQQVASEVRLVAAGPERFKVFSPFHFDDGDHLVIVLSKHANGWRFTDEGHTFMRLTYDVDESDLFRGTRWEIISNTLSMFQIVDENGELTLDVEDENYGDALFAFVQGLLNIANVSYLSRERVRSTFEEDFRTFMTDVVPEERVRFDWRDFDHDAVGNYTVDCRINGMSRPLFVYALSSNTKARDATIALQKFREWGLDFRPVGIFENKDAIAQKVLARFGDVCETQFSSFPNDRGSIERYLKERITQRG